MGVDQLTRIPDPLWPPPEKYQRPLISKTGAHWSVWTGDVWMGHWDSIAEAMPAAMAEACEAIRRTEYVERRESLARFLLELVYGDGAWAEADKDLILNYRLDADDIIKANPHLLSLEERERLEDLIPELAMKGAA